MSETENNELSAQDNFIRRTNRDLFDLHMADARESLDEASIAITQAGAFTSTETTLFAQVAGKIGALVNTEFGQLDTMAPSHDVTDHPADWLSRPASSDDNVDE